MLGIQPKFQTCEKQKNREKKNAKRKTITRTRQYLRGSAICLRPQSCRDFTIIKENYNVRLQCFSFSKTTKRQNPNHKKKTAFISSAQDSQWLQKRAKNFLSAQASALWTKP